MSTRSSDIADDAARPPPVHRLGSLKGFLPLNDTSVPTRGQLLPSLLQNRSIAQLRESTERAAQRASVSEGDNTAEDSSDVDAIGSGLQSRYVNLGRRLSAFSIHSRDEVLNAPQMRSMRLIGNNNPRYEWERYYKSREELKGMKKPM